MPRETAYTYITQKGENEEPPVIHENLNAFKQILGTALLSKDISAQLAAVLSQI